MEFSWTASVSANSAQLWFQTASVLEEVNKLKDQNFLIIHGTADGGFSISFTLIMEFWFYLQCLNILRVRVLKSKGPLPAQCGASEPTGEGGGQLLPAAVPRRGPHSERAPQHPALPADSGQLLPKLPEAKRLPRTCGGWRGGRWLSPESLASLLKASPWTVGHPLHHLGSGCQAHGPNSGKQAHPITPWKFWNTCMLFLVANIHFHCCTVCLRVCLQDSP